VSNLTRRANHVYDYQKLGRLSSLELKNIFQNIYCATGQITSINHPILTRQEGRFANVSNVGQVAVDVGGSFDEWSRLRTAKPWGPGTPTLVSSLWNAISMGDGG
jgi:hypothetical protein